MFSTFTVSARKYRPVRFEDVVGQEGVTTTLKNAIKTGQLAHAYLFCGPRGVGKTTCARILAREVNGFTPDASGDLSTSLNIYELDAASNNSVEDIRSLVDQVRIPPQYGKYKVYIIDEVHMLSAQAFNAFLKTLEEPPPYAIFILATTEKSKIIPTILSRCQIFDFNRITVEDITRHLAEICRRENIQADENALHIIALKADGALRDALSMLDRLVNYETRTLDYQSVINNLNILDYDYYFTITEHVITSNTASALLLYDEILKKGFDGADFLSGLGGHIRNLLVAKDPQTLTLLEATAALKDRYLQQAAQCPGPFLLNALNLVNLCEVGYKASNNKRLHVEIMLIKLCNLKELLNVPPEDFFKVVSNKTVTHPQTLKKEIPRQETAKKEAPPQETRSLNPPAASGRHVSSSVSTEQPDKGDYKAKRARRLTGSFSFSDLQQSPLQDVLTQPPPRPDNEKLTIDPQRLEAAWNDYMQLLQNEKRLSLYSLMSQIKPVIKGREITLELSSKLQLELFNNERHKLVQFLEEQLNITGITLKAEVVKNKAVISPKPFTAQEKFREMAEANPALLDLQKSLDLKLEP
ncbi:MAG: DNA polymerase III subunit gamma/tau [Chitinophagales bacterium]|nr:MAG: DNA polymerase III subunit gamma/tau [Chitinophagales bacterium]